MKLKLNLQTSPGVQERITNFKLQKTVITTEAHENLRLSLGQVHRCSSVKFVNKAVSTYVCGLNI